MQAATVRDHHPTTAATTQLRDIRKTLPLRVLSDIRSLEVFAGEAGRAAISITMLSEGGVVTAAAASADLQLAASGWGMSL